MGVDRIELNPINCVYLSMLLHTPPHEQLYIFFVSCDEMRVSQAKEIGSRCRMAVTSAIYYK